MFITTVMLRVDHIDWRRERKDAGYTPVRGI